MEIALLLCASLALATTLCFGDRSYYYGV